MTVTVQEAVRRGAKLLAEIAGEEAPLEAELLLGYVLGLKRSRLYQRLQETLTAEEERAHAASLERRLQREPLAYIIGRKEFFGISLRVTPAAMIPRLETELLVEQALDFLRSSPVKVSPIVVDVGTGCGAIALALTANLPDEVRVIAIDLSPDALSLARSNAQCLGLAHRVSFLRGDLLQPLRVTTDVIVANLPYVKMAHWVAAPPEIRCFEPRLALEGGPDGLRLIQPLLRQAARYLKAGGALFLEIGEEQGEAVTELAAAAFPEAEIQVRQDLAGLDRVLVLRR